MMPGTSACHGFAQTASSTILPPAYFQQHGQVRFSFVLGSFFPQERVFNNFLASFLGSFSAIHVAFYCI
jgi:hypothetical protein